MWLELLQGALAALFIWAGASKLLNLHTFRKTLLGLHFPVQVLTPASIVLVAAELVAAVLLFSRPQLGGVLAAALFVSFALVTPLLHKLPEGCSCLGSNGPSRTTLRGKVSLRIVGALSALLVTTLAAGGGWGAPAVSSLLAACLVCGLLAILSGQVKKWGSLGPGGHKVSTPTTTLLLARRDFVGRSLATAGALLLWPFAGIAKAHCGHEPYCPIGWACVCGPTADPCACVPPEAFPPCVDEYRQCGCGETDCYDRCGCPSIFCLGCYPACKFACFLLNIECTEDYIDCLLRPP